MNDEIYNRLLKLFKTLGFSPLDKTTENAEIKGYAAGISFADKIMNETYNNMFIDTANDLGLDLYLGLVDKEKQATTEETRKVIIDSFSDNNGVISVNEFQNAVLTLGKNSKYNCLNGVLTISSTDAIDREFFERLEYFIRNYAPTHLQIKLDGNGITFELFDKLHIRWRKLDEYNLPFSVMDTLKTN